ncbi:hypothetical protein AAFF_G00269380 [Aldrovandia affinis]|uniref:Uncharacterized protein n=1 Tax=Aldrovandia affinis TaxID=143900 RepID=A0AAD7WTN9_9TELE|nr:hypothetical protein AAFF_G00269380 [Aldrovandia affinis]
MSQLNQQGELQRESNVLLRKSFDLRGSTVCDMNEVPSSARHVEPYRGKLHMAFSLTPPLTPPTAQRCGPVDAVRGTLMQNGTSRHRQVSGQKERVLNGWNGSRTTCVAG